MWRKKKAWALLVGIYIDEFTVENIMKLPYDSAIWKDICTPMGLPGSSDGKASAYNVEDPGSTPGSGRSPAEGNGNPLQYSCLENPMDWGSW